MSIEIDNLVNLAALLPKELEPWLLHPLSLTDKLKAESGEANLKILEQLWTKPNWWDKFTLGLALSPIMHRNILMYSQQVPCWFARSIIPNDTYQENSIYFDRLQQESLGTIIFEEPSIKRVALLNYAIDESCLEYHWLPEICKKDNSLFWLRLSVFTISNKSNFYLVEIFLPGLLRVIN